VKSIRLLPVVICAAVALLLLKSVGLVTNGGYILAGAEVAQAAGEADHGGDGAEASNDATMVLPEEPTLTDTNPTIEDGAPTLPMRADGAAEDSGHGAADEQNTAAAESGEHGDAAASAATACPPEGEAPAAHETEGADDTAAFDFKVQDGCPVDPGVNAAGDSLPVTKDGAGNLVPMTGAEAGAEQAVLGRLGARREEMRVALVEAAERRIAERTAALEALEARINALVAEKKTVDDGQFSSIVAMYETMKPKDAALIFDQLEMPILLRVASALSPRKMAPIMAKMDPIKAKDLTSNMAMEQAEATIEIGPEDLGALPQIVGQ
jgi:flagellar motility protein MotE (MotC chaperone)